MCGNCSPPGPPGGTRQREPAPDRTLTGERAQRLMESRDDAAERRSVAYVEKMAELRADEVRGPDDALRWLGAHTAHHWAGL